MNTYNVSGAGFLFRLPNENETLFLKQFEGLKTLEKEKGEGVKVLMAFCEMNSNALI